MGVFDFGPDADSIKAELEDLDIEDLDVEVDDNGKVILSGTAASEKVAQKAVKIVSGLDGVEKVKNNYDGRPQKKIGKYYTKKFPNINDFDLEMQNKLSAMRSYS
jgi:nitrate reductase NapAB chaperone NapD